MRHEQLWLADIVEAADAIAAFVSGVDRDSFLCDDLLRSAVLQKLTIIGEAAARLPAEFRQSWPDVPWTDIIRFRGRAVHGYFSVDWTIVWETAVRDAPALRRQITAVLEAEFGEVGGSCHAPQ